MLKFGLKILETISPKLTAKLAYYFMSNPRQNKLKAFEKPIIDKAIKTKVPYKNFELMTYEWGEGEKTALLVHGWEGRCSNFGAVIPVLIENGFKVISFDAPAHGNSTRKSTTWHDYLSVIDIFVKKQKIQPYPYSFTR